MNRIEEIKECIKDFESKKASLKDTLDQIFKLSERTVTEYELLNYWRSESIDEYTSRLVSKSIENWKEIDDKKALVLIKEIFNNINNDSVINTNSEALEKRYHKASGTINDWIFYDDITIAEEILNLLKNNTTISL